MISEPEDDRLDQSLRSKFEQFAPPPTGKVWPGIAPHIGPPPLPRRPLPLPFLFGLTALLAGLAGWLLPHGAVLPKPVASTVQPTSAANKTVVEGRKASFKGVAPTSKRVISTSGGVASTSGGVASTSGGVASTSRGVVSTSEGVAATSKGVVSTSEGVVSTSEGVKPISKGVASAFEAVSLPLTEAGRADSVIEQRADDALPPTLHPLAALERQTLVQLPSTATLAAGPLEAESRTRFVGTLRRERAELLRLQRRTDSLLLALGDLPGAAPAAPVVAAATEADSTKKPAIKHRWSVLLTATPEQNTLTLQGPENDPLTALRRNHETGRAGFSAAALAEYQLTPRVSVGGGLGYSTFGADLRVTNKKTDVSVTYNTTTTTSTNVYASTNQTYSVRIIQVPQQSPIFNSSGQVIGYQTVYVPRQDTVFSTIMQHDTVHTTNHVTTPIITKKETLTTKLLQPNYRFATLPLLMRYRLSLGPGRWWADVAAGAQLQFFLGGTQVVTDDGETFRTQTVTAGNGPFRSLNVALSGSLALNYALTNRLSVSVAPSMRWQALSVYKTETGLIQQPTATGLQLGVRFKL
jgi:hypothetical protein